MNRKNGFVNTGGISIICFYHIKIEKNVLTSWDTLIMDTDLHSIINLSDGSISVSEKEIVIGSHVWIGCRVTMLKGSLVMDDSVVAANSVLSKRIESKSVLIAGNPASVKKRIYPGPIITFRSKFLL